MSVKDSYFIRVNDVTKLCSIGKTTVWKLVKEGKIKTYKPTDGITLFKKEEVLQYFNSLVDTAKARG
ncbi:MAG: helix-turn-helix domain-containing protein [Campylobacteraceae bacterium]|nr:helix-turn-helix domain-containing protein [Campylobacteraceae bacterium]